jgi:hypothetical protein
MRFTSAFAPVALLVALVLVGCGGDGRPRGVLPPADAGPGSDAGPGVDGGPGPGPVGPIDPACTDGLYRETLPNPAAGIDDVAFTGDVPAFVDTVLTRRYPFGLALVEGGRTNTSYGGDCSVIFAGSPADAAALFESLATITHECGHLWDGQLSSGSTNVYEVNADLTLTASNGDTTARGGETFARSLIRGDAYQASRPACAAGSYVGCDSYANTYLDGDPTNSTFEGGDQGFNMLFDEVVQYVNSLATEYAFSDRRTSGYSTSARDGILTFLWYLERYLHMARLDYPSAYARIANDALWRDAILTLWGRAWLYLGLTQDDPSLGIDDDAIKALVMDATLLDELERLRTLAGCT